MLRLVVSLSLIACAFAGTARNGLYPTLDGRIVGGEDTTIEEYPWQISLMRYGSHSCGGSIISSRTILTAAHCTQIQPQALSIRAGSTSKTTGGVIIPVQMIHNHGSYYPYDFDYSILHLEEPLTYGSGIQPIALPAQGQETAGGTQARVSGWGALYSGGASPDTLQVVTVPIVTNEECQEAYYDSPISARMICAGIIGTGGVDSCQGDSGGPLVADGLLVGVVSWGYGCAYPDYPGVYARVSSVRNWVDMHTI